MRLVCFSLTLFLFPASASPQQKSFDSPETAQQKKLEAGQTKCEDLTIWAEIVDGAFDGQENQARKLAPFITDPDDPIWDTLIDCSKSTKSSSQRTKALRAAAMWESLRAEAYRRMYNAAATAPPVKSSQCKNLDRLEARVGAAARSDEKISLQNFREIALELSACVAGSKQLNSNQEQLEALKARKLLFSWSMVHYNGLVADYNNLNAEKKTQREASDVDWSKALADSSSLVTVGTL